MKKLQFGLLRLWTTITGAAVAATVLIQVPEILLVLLFSAPFVVVALLAVGYARYERPRPRIDVAAVARQMRAHPPHRREHSVLREPPEPLSPRASLACALLLLVGATVIVLSMATNREHGLSVFLAVPTLVSVSILVAVLTHRWARPPEIGDVAALAARLRDARPAPAPAAPAAVETDEMPGGLW